MEQVVSIPSAPAGLEMKGRGTDEGATVIEYFLRLVVSLSETTLAEIGAFLISIAISRILVLRSSVFGSGSFLRNTGS